MPDPVQNFIPSIVPVGTQANLDAAKKNFANIFGQLQGNGSVGAHCNSFSTTVAYPNLVTPTGLQVSINASGKHPILVFLRQRTDALATSVYPAGGLFLSADAPSIFYINRGNLPIYGTVLGSGSVSSGPVAWGKYYSPSNILAYDDSPPAGVQTYFLKCGVYAAADLGGYTTVVGTVFGDGSIQAGTGFSAVKNSTGVYTVTFTTAFSVPPVVCLAARNSIGPVIISSGSITVNSFVVGGFNINPFPPVAHDEGFDFNAFGVGRGAAGITFTNVELVAKELI